MTAQLLEVQTTQQLWADRFEGAEEQIFELQDQVATRVLTAIEPIVHLSELARAKQRPPAVLGAHDHVLRAIPLLRILTLDSYSQAEAHLRTAVTIDPDYSIALAFLADCLGREA